MRIIKSHVVVSVLALAAGLATGCSDDAGQIADDASTGGTQPSGDGDGDGDGDKSTGGKAGDGDGDGDGDNMGGDSTGGVDGTGGVVDGTGGSTPGSLFPQLPSVLSLSGCAAVGVGPLCSVTQVEDAVSANCGGVIYEGDIDEDGLFKLVSPETTNEAGETSGVQCIGELKFGRLRTASCVKTTSAVGVPDAEVTCELASDPVVLPGLGCLELPSTLKDVVVCAEGAAANGDTITAGDCKVVQDGCVFQAECADSVVLTGSVTATGVSFNQQLTALANAQGETPAFVAGDVVNHACTAALAGNSLSGSCGAGRQGRGGVNTSVCSVTASAPTLPAVCETLAPTNEHLFVLDSCDILKNGEGGDAGVGEPICAFRQNNCVWEVQCGSNLVFSGRTAPTDTKAKFLLDTGTPCEVAFDSAGKMTGKCTVAGEAACNLSSKTAVPGGACDIMPETAEGFYGRGCGDGGNARLACTGSLQHGCNFMSTCEFTGAGPLLVAGEVKINESTTRNRLEFNGIGDYQCHVEEANASDIANDARVEGEWFGQCQNSVTQGVCRDNYNAETNPGGFRGLQIFWGAAPTN